MGNFKFPCRTPKISNCPKNDSLKCQKGKDRRKGGAKTKKKKQFIGFDKMPGVKSISNFKTYFFFFLFFTADDDINQVSKKEQRHAYTWSVAFRRSQNPPYTCSHQTCHANPEERGWPGTTKELCWAGPHISPSGRRNPEM